MLTSQRHSPWFTLHEKPGPWNHCQPQLQWERQTPALITLSEECCVFDLFALASEKSGRTGSRTVLKDFEF